MMDFKTYGFPMQILQHTNWKLSKTKIHSFQEMSGNQINPRFARRIPVQVFFFC